MANVLKDRATPQNPLGIIALFVFFIEAIATVSLGLVAGQPYALHLVWFIILYPTLIAVSFFVLLWVKREALYSPADFREDSTFKDILLQKVDIIDAKQDAANIGASTNLDDVVRTIDRLIQLGDVRAAINVARAHFKDGEYDKSVKLFDHLLEKIPMTHEVYYKILANRGYALIGVHRYREAVTQLEQMRAVNGGNRFFAWHSLALAYAYFKLKDNKKYQEWLEFSRNAPGFHDNKKFFMKLYPEIQDDL